ncbi:acetoacetate decarboxylase family protein [Micromonospora inyonensis]|uniref:Acetoacetate decarboxylase (ADC) n=1 Tax=Micromonospora inyonensis TaxID=47866 RepID=A0A1C6S4V2_9ACTN|nr:acetoacetate decarboxylase family protein [Micromonospora inyonensis]SCL24506.1 Acetoacetate decarboxylase (ADC) [Micromonospora inyonensis]
MSFSRRERRLRGRYANVDGIPFRMPVATGSSPSLTALFRADADAVRKLLPGRELRPLRIGRHALLLVTVVDYQDTDIGRYIELCVGVPCRRGLTGLGVYIHDLPVSTEISVKGGLGIWGMPKRRASLDFLVDADTVSSQYDLDGRMVLRIDAPRPARTPLPVRFRTVGYGSFRGLLVRSRIRLAGRVGLRRGGRLTLGDHPRARVLRDLGVGSRPLVTAFLPAMVGVLDDHVESWFLTFDAPVPPAVPGLRDVVDLGLGQEWPPPPDRAAADRRRQPPVGQVPGR